MCITDDSPWFQSNPPPSHHAVKALLLLPFLFLLPLLFLLLLLFVPVAAAPRATEEELAIPVNETAKNTAEPTPPPERATKKIRALGAREPGVGKRL